CWGKAWSGTAAAPLPAAGHQGGRADHPPEQPGGERDAASVHFLSPTAVPDSRHKLRNAGRVFATNRETRNLCGEIRLKQACGRCSLTRRLPHLPPEAPPQPSLRAQAFE